MLHFEFEGETQKDTEKKQTKSRQSQNEKEDIWRRAYAHKYRRM